MAVSGVITGLATRAFAGEAAFADEALEEGGDAVGREGPFEGEADIFVGHGVVVGKEGGEALVDVGFLSIESLTKGNLVDAERQSLGQQLTVGLEVNPCDADITTMIAAVLHLYLALEREAEGTDARQRDGIAFLHLVEHHALQIAQRVLQLTR